MTIVAFKTEIIMLNVDINFEEKRELKTEQLVHSIILYLMSISPYRL